MSSDTHVYLDLDAVNKGTGGRDPPILKFMQTRDHPFLQDSSAEYFVSILRFYLQTGDDIPVFIPRIEEGPNQMEVDKTVYKLSIFVDGGNGTISKSTVVPLYWQSWNNAPVPPTPVVKQDMTSRYYHMNNFTQFCAMMNTAFGTAFFGTITGYTDGVPVIEFDDNTGKFTIRAGYEAFYSRTKIGFNTALYELLSGFPTCWRHKL